MSPASGPLGGGTDLAITGTNFTDVTDVTIGGSELGGRMVVSPTQITGHTLAANTPGAKDVVVTSGSHGSGTCRGCFSYNPAVTVTAVSPAGGPIDGGTRVTITGTNFTNVTSVTIGLSELGSRTVVSANQITGTTPAAISPGARPVTVFTNASGSGTCDNCFTYDPIVVVAQPFAAGDGHTCGLTSAGAAFCWGYNYWGQLGTGSTTSSSTPVAVSGGLSFSALAAGVYHTCGLTMVGAAYCWGTNFFGAVGNGQYGYTFLSPVAVSGDLSFSALATGAWHTCGLSSAGTAYCWGSNSFGQIGNGTNQSDLTTPTAVSGGLHFSALAAGYRFNCGVTGAGAAYCWGENSTGQLGNGSATESRVPVAVSGNLSFSAVAAGATYACGLTSAGAAYCWGSNVVGQLGTSSTTSSSTPVPVSGGLTFTALAGGVRSRLRAHQRRGDLLLGRQLLRPAQQWIDHELLHDARRGPGRLELQCHRRRRWSHVRAHQHRGVLLLGQQLVRPTWGRHSLDRSGASGRRLELQRPGCGRRSHVRTRQRWGLLLGR